ncbi:hypothetical protein PC129_g5036 [Phytophthora cactorum]|uniref:Uncharacterized protein n=1 Tax=Phytophthora cactorum TaxID=29920 RepID=A0A8T1IHC6_9STRA|nr:hypothetical protein PC114_g7416 [Phytophthora cactorum]KAG2988843.1 hypothetical protein PC118_g6474 [Phytophthora cactorum]KAG3027951.1 hypothetical protein PC119_g7188 [Phytophthora cactorum]KAG3092267.1 hypothetical protein PC122_g6628 [Phytophthora cactorum]KAG3224310.1 hypothetical protein PC129_g5036 [Phytophthora cactorum]
MDVREGKALTLLLYTDVDYANNPDDCKSISGYDTMIDGNVISHASGAECTEYDRSGLCDELQWEYETPLLLGDNMASIYLTARPGKHSRTKHIEKKFHVSRDLVEKKELEVQHVGTNAMVADIMTKALGAVKFARFHTALEVLPPQALR